MKKYNKLVRDKIPEIIENDNNDVFTRTLDDEEYLTALNDKLKEEVFEYLESEDINELVDIFDVLCGILEARNISFLEFDELRYDKISKNGSFNNRTFLETVIPNTEFYNIFTKIIRECQYNNTYKFAWAKSLVELASENEYSDGVIYLEDISEKFIGYYWNQYLIFDFKQGQRTPKIISLVKDLMNSYSDFHNPNNFNRAEDILKTEFKNKYDKCLKDTNRVLKKDVSWRFIILDGVSHDEIYQYKKDDDKLFIKQENLKTLRENKDYLLDLINYRWGLVLDKFEGISGVDKITGELSPILLEKFKNYF